MATTSKKSTDPFEASKYGSKGDHAKQFHLEKVAPGTAPRESTFYPDPSGEIPPLSNYAEDDEVDPDATRADALDSFGGDTAGATSATVDAGLGHPVSGQSSKELHHDGRAGRKKERSGLDGTGASVDKLTGKQAAVLPQDEQD